MEGTKAENVGTERTEGTEGVDKREKMSDEGEWTEGERERGWNGDVGEEGLKKVRPSGREREVAKERRVATWGEAEGEV